MPIADAYEIDRIDEWRQRIGGGENDKNAEVDVLISKGTCAPNRSFEPFVHR